VTLIIAGLVGFELGIAATWYIVTRCAPDPYMPPPPPGTPKPDTPTPQHPLDLVMVP
jgi:hypothetical protein